MWDSPRVLNTAAMLIATVAIVAFTIGAAAWASRRPFFTLKSIRVEPSLIPGATAVQPFRHVNATAIHADAVPRILATTRSNFFTVDLEAVRHAIESVAWVRRAQVRREWPNRLVVKVEEQQVLAIWDDGRLVNTYGELFAANPAEAEEDSKMPLPELAGPVGSERDVASRYLDLKSWLAKLSLVPDQVTLSPRYAWSVHIDNGTATGLTIDLGRERDANTLPDRVLRMINAWPTLTSRWPRPTLIDLRYPNGFALRADGLRLAEDKSVKPAFKAPPKPANKPSASPNKPAAPRAGATNARTTAVKATP